MGSGASFRRPEDFSLYRRMRPACDDCGRRNLAFGRVAGMIGYLGPAQLVALSEGLEAFGGNSDTVMWSCACGNFGIFG